MGVNLQTRKLYVISQMGDDYIDAGHCEMRYQCPFCKELGLRNNDYKLYVNYKKGAYWCFRCESTGYITFDELSTGESNSDASTYIEKLILGYGKKPEDEKDDPSDYFMIPRNIPMPDTLAWNYLISRGITPDDMSYYSIRVPSVIHDEKKFFGRIIIPNRVISHIWTDLYVARTYIDDPIRYKNPSSSKAHDLVFNLHRIKDSPKRIIINEGAINSIIAGRDSVATFGKYVSDIQLSQILSKHPQSIYVSLDTDARKLAEQLCTRIKSLSDARVFLVELPTQWNPDKQEYKGLDASDLGKEVYSEYVNHSREFESSAIYSIENSFNKIVGGQS